MATIKPFMGIRPPKELVEQVVTTHYLVLQQIKLKMLLMQLIQYLLAPL